MASYLQHQPDLKNRTGLVGDTCTDLSASQISCFSHRIVEAMAMTMFHIQFSLFISDSKPLAHRWTDFLAVNRSVKSNIFSKLLENICFLEILSIKKAWGSVMWNLGEGDFVAMSWYISHVVCSAHSIARALMSADVSWKEVTSQFTVGHILSLHCGRFYSFFLFSPRF